MNIVIFDNLQILFLNTFILKLKLFVILLSKKHLILKVEAWQHLDVYFSTFLLFHSTLVT